MDPSLDVRADCPARDAEVVIGLETQPHLLTVVSNDHRLHAAARCRPCLYLPCLDWINKMKRSTKRLAEGPEKPE